VSVELINGYVILPHVPDWRREVAWSRQWGTKVERSVEGPEYRMGTRSTSRHKISWQVTPFDLEESTALIERLRAAIKTGLAATGFWGRGAQLSAALAPGDILINLRSSSIAWALWTHVLFAHTEADQWDTWEVAEILAAPSSSYFGLAAGLTYAWADGDWCWPLIMGRLLVDDPVWQSDQRGTIDLELQQLDYPPIMVPDLCAVTLVAVGGGDTFECYRLEDPLTSTLSKGTAWDSDWVVYRGYLGVQGVETFESYAQPSNNMNGGWGWENPWVIYQGELGTFGCEDFEDYDLEDPIEELTVLDEGWGWFAAWVIFEAVGCLGNEDFEDYALEDPLDPDTILAEGEGWEPEGSWEVDTI
jgi:hypothetical protein